MSDSYIGIIPEALVVEEDSAGFPVTFEPAIIEHIEQINDYMCGAVGEGDDEIQLPDNDATVCLDHIDYQATYMPFRLVGARELVQIEGLLDDPDIALRILTDEFWTTVYGIHCAIHECQSSHVNDEDRDTVVLGALARRGGIVDAMSSKRRDVVYPEHLVPIIDEYDRLYDKEYWDVIFAEGNLWEELKDNRVYPRYSGINSWLA